MKKILITGANSYIGTSFEKYIKENYPNDYVVDTVDMIDGTWRDKDFSGYDSVFHVAGIAHQKETNENAHLYYKINRDLAIETATKASSDGVKQFVFLSSMSIYGMETGVITKDTEPNPTSSYGESKLQAESGIFALQSDDYSVTIVRPPMVYGKNCKGNFQAVVKLVKKLPIFPRVNNKRSMIYIDNLCEFIRIVIENKSTGVFCPQNKEYVRTDEMARIISESINKKIIIDYITGIGVVVFRPLVKLLQKAFGTLIYEDLEEHNFSYCVKGFEESVKESV